MSGERSLPVGGGGNGVGRRSEGDEERISLRIDDATRVGGERSAQDLLMGGQELVVTTLTDAIEQPRRTFDIREEEGDGPGRQLGVAHAWTNVPRQDWTVKELA